MYGKNQYGLKYFLIAIMCYKNCDMFFFSLVKKISDAISTANFLKLYKNEFFKQFY